jgi:hypothetical protein
MKLQVKIALITGALALATGPAALASGKPEGVPSHGPGTHGAGQEKGPNYAPGEPTPGPKAGLPAKANAYGRYCKGASKKRTPGEEGKGTPFSRCVTAMAKAANHENMAPGRACKGEPRKKSQQEKEEKAKGTPFSRCVHSVIEMRRNQEQGAEGS